MKSAIRKSSRAILILLLIGTPAAAQRPIKPRPRLPRGTDSCSSQGYITLGTSQLREHPDRAVEAYLWAARLEPDNAAILSALRVALLMSDDRVARYWGANRIPANIRALMLAADSVRRQAWMLDPFVRTPLDREVVRWLIVTNAELTRAEMMSVDDAEMWNDLRHWTVIHNEHELRGELAWATGSLADARAAWADAIAQHPGNPRLHAQRARAFYLERMLDSARAEMAAAVRLADRAGHNDLDVAESRAQWEFSLGRIDEAMGRMDSARANYEAALTHDLSYYPAHLRLGVMAMMSGEAARGLTEMERAVAVKEDEFMPQFYYAVSLGLQGRNDSAIAHMRRAIALEPWMARPHRLLGDLLLGQRDSTGALAEYDKYLSCPLVVDPALAQVRARADSVRAAHR